MKYCIGCIHLDLMPGFQGSGGGTYTGPGSYFDPELLCEKKHWERTLSGEEGENMAVDIEREMRRAETCPDYKERS
jgi:hypothetical protein